MKTIRWQFVAEGDGEYAAPFRNAEDVAVDLARREVTIADRERFVVYLLDAKHRPIAFETVSVGVLDGSLIHPREVFKSAIAGSAAAVLLAHNHPSGDPTPSGQDREVTRRLKAAGELLGVPVVDHVIVGPRGDHFSFREGGDWS
jgi:DNA repair protein RadC